MSCFPCFTPMRMYLDRLVGRVEDFFFLYAPYCYGSTLPCNELPKMLHPMVFYQVIQNGTFNVKMSVFHSNMQHQCFQYLCLA